MSLFFLNDSKILFLDFFSSPLTLIPRWLLLLLLCFFVLLGGGGGRGVSLALLGLMVFHLTIFGKFSAIIS